MAEKTGRPAESDLELLTQALDNVKPMVEVSRVASAAPLPGADRVRATPPDPRHALGHRGRHARSEKSMAQRLASELSKRPKTAGAACASVKDTHRMADANKAFAHYRW